MALLVAYTNADDVDYRLNELNFYWPAGLGIM